MRVTNIIVRSLQIHKEIRLDNLTLVFNHLCCHDNDPNLTFNLINVISYKHILPVRKLRFIPVPIFKNNIQSSSEAPFLRKIRKLKIGLNLVVVRKYRESGARSRNSNFFLFHQKSLLVNYFQKQYSKVPAKLHFCEKWEG